jgi:hypothetical protein
MKGQPVSVSKTKKAIADYEKAIGRPDGIAELSIFYCEEAFGFLESCSICCFDPHVWTLPGSRV